MRNSIMFLVITLIFLAILTTVRAENMPLFAGVCDGRKGDNLPSWNQTVSLYKKMNIGWIRLYEPFPDLLKSLEGTGIFVAIGPKNEDIKRLSDHYDFAVNWVMDVITYNINFNWIIVGNDVIQGEVGPYVLDAIKNIRKALNQQALPITHITTALSTAVLANSYLPSTGVLKPEITKLVTEIVSFLSSWDTPLMVNVYPYFAYAADPTNISLEYATFRSTSPVVRDGNYQYTNMFDATVDSFNAALEKIGYGGVKVYVAETGWPTRGNPPYTSVENARAYNQGLLKKLTTGTKGTPRRPDVAVFTFFYEMFNEDLKQGDVEKSFGFFTPNMVPIYDMWNVSLVRTRKSDSSSVLFDYY